MDKNRILKLAEDLRAELDGGSAARALGIARELSDKVIDGPSMSFGRSPEAPDAYDPASMARSGGEAEEVIDAVEWLCGGNDLYDPVSGTFLDSYINDRDPELIVRNLPVGGFSWAVDDMRERGVDYADGAVCPYEVARDNGEVVESLSMADLSESMAVISYARRAAKEGWLRPGADLDDLMERSAPVADAMKWFGGVDSRLVGMAVGFPACWGWQFRISDDGAYVTEDQFNLVLPTQAERDLYLLMANDGVTCDTVAHASDPAWMADRVKAVMGSDESVVYGTEVYPDELSAGELGDLSSGRRDLFTDSCMAMYPHLASRAGKSAGRRANPSPAEMASAARRAACDAVGNSGPKAEEKGKVAL